MIDVLLTRFIGVLVSANFSLPVFFTAVVSSPLLFLESKPACCQRSLSILRHLVRTDLRGDRFQRTTSNRLLGRLQSVLLRVLLGLP